MTKSEVLGSLMYELLLKDQIDFEADDESFTAYKTEKGYTIQGLNLTAQVQNKSELRKEIGKLGRQIVQL